MLCGVKLSCLDSWVAEWVIISNAVSGSTIDLSWNFAQS